MTNLLGVCSWSLTPDNEADLIDRVLACRLRRVQLALDPIREGQMDLRTLRERLADAGISVCSGMLTTVGEDYTTLGSIRRTGGVRPDEYWEENLSRARRCAAIAGELRVGLVTFHAGYIPEDDPALRGIMVERIAAVAAMFSEHGVRIGLETGQETAELLLDVLQTPDLQGVGVNFDPANMILYGMGDPCAAVETLSERIVQVHIKDAIASSQPGQWGREVPVGAGEVDWARFLGLIGGLGRDIDMLIEREAGEARGEDIVAARELVEKHLGAASA